MFFFAEDLHFEKIENGFIIYSPFVHSWVKVNADAGNFLKNIFEISNGWW